MASVSIPFRFADRPRILIAEDNRINQEVLTELLAAMGCDSDVVEDGEQVLNALSHRSYPLVLMDCQMPVLDGYETTRQIRLLDGAVSRVPVIAVTAHAAQGEVEKVLEAGMNNYLSKPVEPRALAEALADWLPLDRERSRSVVSEPSDPDSAQACSTLVPSVRRSASVIGLFLKLVPEQIQALAVAVESSDVQLLKEHAHRLKGGCRSIGAQKLGQLCFELEQDTARAPQILEALRAEHRIVVARLKVELRQVSG